MQVKVREGGKDWGWGVVVNVVKKPPTASGSLPAALSALRGSTYIVDTLLHCSLGSSENESRPKPCLPIPGEKGEMHVVRKYVSTGKKKRCTVLQLKNSLNTCSISCIFEPMCWVNKLFQLSGSCSTASDICTQQTENICSS